ncbi:hypothetical protein D9M68_798400 [compost metagenome]
MRHLLALLVVDAAFKQLEVGQTVGLIGHFRYQILWYTCFTQLRLGKTSLRVDMVNVEMPGQVEARENQREQREGSLVAIGQLDQLIQLLLREGKGFATSGHHTLDLRNRKSRLRMGTNLLAQGSQQGIQTAAPDTRSLEQAANEPLADILTILRVLDTGQVALPRFAYEQVVSNWQQGTVGTQVLAVEAKAGQ